MGREQKKREKERIQGIEGTYLSCGPKKEGENGGDEEEKIKEG